MGWGGANNVPWHLHLVCVAVRKYAATLADVFDVREHKFHGMSILLFAKLAHALGATLASKLCCYASWSQRRSNLTPHDLEVGANMRESSSGSIMLPSLVPSWKSFPMLVADLRKDVSKPFGHGISWINKHFHSFPRC